MPQAVLLVVQKGDHSLGYYDFETGEALARVEVDPYPHEFAVAADGSRAYLCHFGVALAEDEGPGGNTVSVVDVPGRRRLGAVDCGAYRRPHDLALDASGTAYICSEGSSHVVISRNPAGGGIDGAVPTGGEGSHIISVTGDGRLAFVSNMKSNTVTAVFPGDSNRAPVVIPVAARPEGSVLDEAEETLYVACRDGEQVAVIDVQALAAGEPLQHPPGPVRICWGPGGRLLVPLYHEKALAVTDPRAGVQQIIPLPATPISVGYDAATGMGLCSTFGNQVCVVDVAGGQVARTIATAADPDPVAVVRV